MDLPMGLTWTSFACVSQAILMHLIAQLACSAMIASPSLSARLWPPPQQGAGMLASWS